MISVILCIVLYLFFCTSFDISRSQQYEYDLLLDCDNSLVAFSIFRTVLNRTCMVYEEKDVTIGGSTNLNSGGLVFNTPNRQRSNDT